MVKNTKIVLKFTMNQTIESKQKSSIIIGIVKAMMFD